MALVVDDLEAVERVERLAVLDADRHGSGLGLVRVDVVDLVYCDERNPVRSASGSSNPRDGPC